MDNEDFEYCSFSINDYDEDGDEAERGIYLHFGTVRLHIADSLGGFRGFINHLKYIEMEIQENYCA